MKWLPIKKISVLLTCLLVLVFQQLIAQTGLKQQRTPGWYSVDSSVNIKAGNFFTRFSADLGMQPGTEMRQLSVKVGVGNISHYRYQQYYNGIKVIGGDFILHEKNGSISSANGNIKTISTPPASQLPFQSALDIAKPQSGYQRFAWENPVAEAQIKEFKKTASATFSPQRELVYVENNQGIIQLCYSIKLYNFDGVEGKEFFINTATGVVENTVPLTYNCTSLSAATSMYGTRTVTIQKQTSPTVNWKLIDDCQTANITVKDFNSGTPTVYQRSDPPSFPTSPVNSLWTAKQVYNFYKSVFTRNSWDGNNAAITIHQNAQFGPDTALYYDNASFSPSTGIFSVGNNSGPTEASNSFVGDDRNTLHTLGHELTHGVTSTEANLVYSKEPGGLNESFSDIFGVNVYQWFFGSVAHLWMYGYDRVDASGNHLIVRRMDNPYLSNQPKFYKGLKWVNTTTATDASGDNWGVHTNSGVQNYFYYLLTVGGSGVTEDGDPFNVSGIGIVAARTLAYDVLCNRLITSSQYVDARAAWIQAANDAYGNCSNVAIQVAKAWNAVGVYCPTTSVAYNRTICNTTYVGSAPALVSAYNDVKAGGPGCTTTVSSGSQNLVFAAGNAVTLSPGFTAVQGATFTATSLNECVLTYY